MLNKTASARSILFLYATVLAASCLSTACGGKVDSASSLDSPPLSTVESSLGLDNSVDDSDGISSVPAPAGVDQRVWAELKAALQQSMQAAAATRLSASAPSGGQNMVQDLLLEALDGQSARLSWGYRSVGDYDQNSEVNIADLTPIGLNLGKSEAATDWPRARLADGDGNGLITIADVTPIGANYGNRVSFYSIRRSSAASPGTFSELMTVPFQDGTASPEVPGRTFSATANGLAEGDSLVVVPVDSADMHSGAASVEVQFSSGLRPQNFTASQGSLPGEVLLSWDAVEGATGYLVQRRHPSLTVYEDLGEVAESVLQFSDTDVTEGQHRFYRVAALLDSGQSAWSDSAEGWSMQRPAAPGGLLASAGTVLDVVELSWDPVANADGYRLYRDEGPVPLSELPETEFTDDTVTDPAVHLYEVSAYNAAGESQRSAAVSGNAGVIPLAPDSFSASLAQHPDHVSLSWQASQWATGYRIYRDSVDNQIVELGAILSYDDFSVGDFNVHPYWITAYTALGESAVTGPQNGSLLQLPPAVPQGLVSSQGSLRDAIELSWNAVAGAEQYLVYRDGDTDPLATVGPVSSYVDNAISDLDPHSYRLRASNMAGQSELSDAATGFVDNRSDWWRFGRNNLHTSLGSAPGPAGNGLAWSYPTGSWIRCNPVMAADGTVYFGNYAGKLVALNKDGSEKWTYTAGSDIYTSPAIARDGTVYVGSHDMKLHAVNPDGSQAWTYSTGGIVRSSPAIDDMGRIYFGSQDHYLYCLNAGGSLAWKFQTGEEVRSSPAIAADGTVYVGSGKDNQLNAINPDGSLKWKYNAGGWVRSSPAIAVDGTIYVGSSNGQLHAVNPSGSQKWVFDALDYIENCSPAIAANGRIYIGSGDDRLYCIDPASGLEIWHYTTGGDIDSSPAIDASGTIYVGSDDFKLHAVNPNGTEKWTYTTGALVDSGPLVGEDGRIYFGSSDGGLYCIGPDL